MLMWRVPEAVGYDQDRTWGGIGVCVWDCVCGGKECVVGGGVCGPVCVVGRGVCGTVCVVSRGVCGTVWSWVT